MYGAIVVVLVIAAVVRDCWLYARQLKRDEDAWDNERIR